MTLILSLLSPRFVVQVSDRRVVEIPSLRPVSDERNKAVFLLNRMAFGYTGLAQMLGAPTDRWLTEALSQALASHPMNLPATIMEIAPRATRTFGNLRSALRAVPHTFVGVGWNRRPSALSATPITVIVSNTYDDAAMLLSPPGARFTTHLRRPPDGETALGPYGQPFGPEERAHVLEAIEPHLDRPDAAPRVIELLAAAVRSVAAVNSAVGHSLMVNYIPHEAALSSDTRLMAPIGGEVDWTKACAFYLPGDPSTRTLYMPNYVGPYVSFRDARITFG